MNVRRRKTLWYFNQRNGCLYNATDLCLRGPGILLINFKRQKRLKKAMSHCKICRNSFLTTFFFHSVIRSQRQETWNRRRSPIISTQFKCRHSFLSQRCHHSINYLPNRVFHFARTSPAFFHHQVERVAWLQCKNINAWRLSPQTFWTSYSHEV